MNSTTLKITRAGVIAALYTALTVVFSSVAYGPIQFRPSEALTLLPILFPEAILGVTVGCILSNLLSPVGLPDMIFGPLVTLAAAYLTYYFRRSILAYAFPIVLNGLFVSLYLYKFYKLPYLYNVLTIGGSEAVVVLILGIPLIVYLRKYLEQHS
ncbi:MAG: QueT transporter family protein [Acidobacteriota bacterium]